MLKFFRKSADKKEKTNVVKLSLMELDTIIGGATTELNEQSLKKARESEADKKVNGIKT